MPISIFLSSYAVENLFFCLVHHISTSPQNRVFCTFCLCTITKCICSIFQANRLSLGRFYECTLHSEDISLRLLSRSRLNAFAMLRTHILQENPSLIVSNHHIDQPEIHLHFSPQQILSLFQIFIGTQMLFACSLKKSTYTQKIR